MSLCKCKWSISVITTTVTTVKRPITNKRFTGEKKQTIILIYYIQTMKRLPCLLWS